jgi:hypothetical protein
MESLTSIRPKFNLCQFLFTSNQTPIPVKHRRVARGNHGQPKVLLGPTMPTLLRPAGRLPLKRPYGRSRGSLPAGQTTCGRILPPWTPNAIRLCSQNKRGINLFRTFTLFVLGEVNQARKPRRRPYFCHKRTVWGV